MIFCIAGTGDGRALALRLRKENWPVLVSVVSEYGERLVQAADLPVVQTALDQAGMEVFLQEQGIRLVVDASHPYAVNVSRNAMAACEKVKVPYVLASYNKFDYSSAFLTTKLTPQRSSR